MHNVGIGNEEPWGIRTWEVKVVGAARISAMVRDLGGQNRGGYEEPWVMSEVVKIRTCRSWAICLSLLPSGRPAGSESVR